MLTKVQAKILANMLTKQQYIVLRFLAGKDETARIFATPEVIDDLIDLDLARRDKTVENEPKDVLLLTAKGKKVAEFI